VRSYLRDRPELTEAVMTLKPFRAMRRLLEAIRLQLARLIGVTRRRIAIRVPRGQRATGADQPDAEGVFRFFHLGGLSRQERTIYYYLSILRRAARQGYPRRSSQTPYEYDAKLGPNVPQAEEEMDRLTEAFVETRYSTHRIDEERERRVRGAWKRVRAALRALKPRSDNDEDDKTK